MESSPTRPARLTTAERKRLTDRKAQRQRRERIKSYIARLEKTLEELTAASGDGIQATLLKQLEQQRLKTERLTNVINHIQEVLEETRSSSSPAPESPLLTQDEFSSGILNAGPGPGPGASTSTSTGTGTGTGATRHISNPTASGKQPQQQQSRPTFTINIDLATKISLHSQNPSNSQTRNYFQVVNESISNVAREQNAINPSTAADDDDLAIRAILHGWDSIRDADGGRTDRAWGLLQALDQGIFSQTGLVERVAILRLMRSTIKWHMCPQDHTIPSFMFPTVTQSMVPHAPIIDFFAWPNLRDHLIISGITHITETTAALYVSQIRLKWPYELRDICKFAVAENRYRFSSEFDSVYYDLQSWTIASPPLQMLIENGPSMAGLELGNGSVASGTGLGLGSETGGRGQGQGQGGLEGEGEGEDAGSYWDRLLEGCDQM